ncbi:MAG: hypothetical protein WA989_06290 [Henriciella sp.]|uniref:hypothetical protein n=1 Tax=Henriciella sp. TaxID=1968823 RepID=UPI003C715672
MTGWPRLLPLIGLLALPVAAQTSAPLPPNLSGLWTFEADVQQICSFTGQARLIPRDDPSSYGCELTARQDCPAVDVTYTVEQTCTADVEDGVLTVRSTIVNFLEGSPTGNYLPDNFQLRIEDASTLNGVLLGTGAYPAIWRRAEGAIS